MDLAALNALPAVDAERELLACCGSRRWAAAVAAGRPYRDLDHLQSAAEDAWWSLGEADWHEAFAAHPRIGERAAAEGAAGHGTSARWSAAEQSAAGRAEAAVRDEIARGNRAYEERFGHVFLIAAHGRSGEEILGELRRRLDGDAAGELRTAAGEQAKITRLRLARLVQEPR